MKYTKDLEKSDKWIVAITALCAILLFSWLVYDVFFFGDDQKGQIAIGKIYETQNKVKRKYNHSLFWHVASQEDIVYENDWIFTGAQSVAKIRLESGSEIIVEPDSLIILSRKNGLLQLDLQHGRLLADVKNKDVQINIIRDGKKQTISSQENGQVISVAQLIGQDIEQPAVDFLDLNDKDASLSELADKRNYKAQDGYTDLDELGLSYRITNEHFANLYPGDKTTMTLQWEDPLEKYVAYEVSVSNDANFSEAIAQGMVNDTEFSFQHGVNESLFWRVKGLSAEQASTQWSKNQDALLVINWLQRGDAVKLKTAKKWHKIKREKLNRVQADRSYNFDEDESLKVTWEKANGADKYRVEISDTPDFSNIREQKVVEGTEVDVKNLKLGQNYFRVIPENKNGVQTAEVSQGTLGTLLPAPEKLRTLGKVSHQVLQWTPVEHAQMYKVVYKTDKNQKTPNVKYIKDNRAKVDNETGFLQWHVQAVDPETKTRLGTKSDTVDWYDAAKRLASLHKTGEAGDKYPKITKPAPRKTFMSVNGSPLFIVLNWTYAHPAKAFDVEVSKTADMNQLIFKKRVQHQNRAVLNQKIAPGVYFMRVRALQDDITQEAWSKPEVFRVIDRKVKIDK